MIQRLHSFFRWVWGGSPDESLRSIVERTPAVWVITGVVIVISIVDFIFKHSSGFGVMTYFLGDSDVSVARGQAWRLLTWSLVNPAVGGGWRDVSGLEHLAGNIVGLLLAGPRVERALGAGRFVALVVVTALCGSAALMAGRALTWDYSGGTSGVVYGIVGALLVLAYIGRNATPSERRFFVFVWVAVGLLALVAISNSASSNRAHFGGFLGGLVLAAVWKGGRLKLPRPGLAAATILTLVALLVVTWKCGLVRRADAAVAAEIPVSRSPVLLSIAFDSVWVDGEGNGPLIRIDKGTNRVVAEIRAGTGGDMEPVGGSLWVAAAHSVVEIDPKTNRVKSRIELRGDGPWGLAAHGDVLWAALPDRNSIARIDLKSRRVTETEVGLHPYSVVAAAGGVWATSFDGQMIARLDPKSGKIVREAFYDFRPYWIEFVRGSLWVGEQGGVSRIDAETLKVIDHVDVGENVWQMAVDVEGQLWVAERFGFEVSQIDTRSNKVVRRIRVGLRQPLGIAAEEDLWIADSVNQQVLYAQP